MKFNLFFVLLLVIPPFVLSGCRNKPIVFNFGDSNSDTGGAMAGLGNNIPLPIGRIFPRQPSGRLCDGRLIIDFLCEHLNMSYLNAYLDALESDFEHGANFAIAGAATQAYATNPFSLHVQVLQFLLFRSRSLKLLNLGYNKQLIDEEGFNNALYTFDIGQNDLYGAFAYNFTNRTDYVVSEIKNAIQTIHKEGGKNFWVHNTGPFGCLPERLSLQRNDSDLDQHGCLSTLNNGAKILNEKLSMACDELNSGLQNATVVYTDIYSIKYDLIANHSDYGFESPELVCCGYGGPPNNFNSSLRCGAKGSQACPVGSKYVSWDGVHYTEAANAFVVTKILTTDYSKPPISFDHFCT